MYSGETRQVTMRWPLELIDKLDAKATEFELTRTMLVRIILEMAVMPHEQIVERWRRENAMRKWFRNGGDESTYPPQVDKWSNDDAMDR